MDKYEYIVNLAEKTAKRVSQNRESWMKFLTSAARIYKYPFKEQLLIYAQNPDATACASIEIWNKRMNCWVNKDLQELHFRMILQHTVISLNMYLMFRMFML